LFDVYSVQTLAEKLYPGQGATIALAGMRDLPDHVISVDPIRLFKTSPESYGLVQKFIAVEKE
jgi:FMN phosphatase YigB (HAD superfamily)